MNATGILKYGQLTVLHTIDGFPESAWETSGACGYWSVKDILAHLASYERVLVDILASFTTAGVPTPALDTFIEMDAQFNDSEVSRRKGNTIQDVLAEFNDAHAQVMTLVASISPEKLREVGTLPWYGSAYSLDDMLVYMYYGHKREHSAQIAAFCDILNQQ
ncbi:MAG TPA: DinB family protein [Ktedonobacteraceae bacterium]|nr:DinB family protein [Ktedonobacteraceae bacterium]